jgi:spermidine/putrescine transport system substrate-binding protein
MNTDDEGQLSQVRDLLLSVKPYVDTVNEVYINDFQAGKIDLGITYSGDGLRIQNARKKEGDIDVVAPEGKSEIWIDNWAISAYAPDPVAAHAWINFILEPDVNAKEMEYNALEVPTPASYPLVGELAKNPLVVFEDRILNDYEILFTTPERQNTRQRIWNEFKAA